MGNHTSGRIMDLSTLDFSEYEVACQDDLDVRSFDSKLRDQTGKAIAAVANGVDQLQQSVSLDSLKEVTTALADLDLDAMEVILEHKEDVLSEKSYLRDLVEEFFENSRATLEFCTAVQSSIKRAKDNQLILEKALSIMPMDRKPIDAESERILHLFALFKEAGDPFDDNLILKFIAVRDKHVQLLEKLSAKHKSLDKRFKKVKLWAKVSSVLFGAAVAAVLICTVVAAAIAAPLLATALIAVCNFPLVEMRVWLKSKWSGYEKEMKAQQDLVKGMINKTHVAIHELDTIKSLMESLETQFKSIVFNIEFASEHEKDVAVLEEAVMGITIKKTAFVRELDGLQVYIGQAEHRIRGARTLVSQSLLS